MRRFPFSVFRFPFGAAFLFIALLVLISAFPARAADAPEIAGFQVVGEPGAWPEVLRSFGLMPQAEGARIIVVNEKQQAENGEGVFNGKRETDNGKRFLDSGKILILVGDSAIAQQLGIRPTGRHKRVKRLRDLHAPDLPITWEQALDVPVFTVPPDAKVISSARGSKAPLMVTLRRGRGGVLWVAVPPGAQGYERFPFLLHALSELGVQPSLASRRLWAFYDAAYQRDRDFDELAREWRQMGVSSVHAGAWNYFEPHPTTDQNDDDERLRKLIEACHRQGILVYAWLELPHVSAEFWDKHPEWREKTAKNKDAAVDWRLLMNLTNPQCRQAVIAGVHSMLERFDWDGVNFAELYFDGVYGIKEPAEFTPLNADVRKEVRRLHGFDPMELFNGRSRDPKKVRQFLDYRADLAAQLQETWIDELEKMRAEKPHLDLVLTHVDDRFDTTMRDAIGADAARLLKVLDQHELTFIIEDPATVWNLGPSRYSEIARQYRPLTPHQERLGVDINLVERQRAHPTSMQTGVELAELIHTASEAFSTVMFYYTGSITPLEVPILAPSQAVVARCENTAEGMVVESPFGVGVRWSGPVTLDGKDWPVQDREFVWVPAGKHLLKAATADPELAVTDFNGQLQSATYQSDGVEIAYASLSRAFAKLNRKPAKLLIDGQEAKLEVSGDYVVRLPRGKHTARIVMENAPGLPLPASR